MPRTPLGARRLGRGLARHWLSIVIGLTLTVAGAVGLVWPSPVAIALGLIASAYGLVGVARPVVLDRAAARAVYAEERHEPLVPALRTPLYRDWTVVRRGRCSAVHDPHLDAELRAERRIPLRVADAEWRPPEPAEPVRALLSAAWPSLHEDGLKIRLASDLVAGAPTATVQPTRYSCYLVTNKLAHEELFTVGRHRLLNAEDAVLHAGAIPNLAHPAKCSNHIGVDVLACIDGNHLLVTKQSHANDTSKGLWAPAGSGSADWTDIVGDDLLRTVRTAMERELSEELDLRTRTRGIVVTGYARLEHLAGKPQFYGVARMTTVTPGIRPSERRYVDDHRRIEFDPDAGPDALDAAIAEFERAAAALISMPLHMSFLLLRRWLRTDERAWRWLIGA